MQNLSNLTTEHIKEYPKGTWLTKDRKWSLAFCFVMTFGATFASMASDIKHLEDLSWIIFGVVFAILIASMLIFNRTKSIPDDRFLNSENIEIKSNQLPGPILGFILGFTMGFPIIRSVVTTLWNFPIPIQGNFGLFIWFMPFSLYFIIKNCPITILFNKNFIKVEPLEVDRKYDYKRTDYYNRNKSSTDRNNIVTNPAYSSLGCNIFNNKRY